jgi:hypothetical protein
MSKGISFLATEPLSQPVSDLHQVQEPCDKTDHSCGNRFFREKKIENTSLFCCYYATNTVLSGKLSNVRSSYKYILATRVTATDSFKSTDCLSES